MKGKVLMLGVYLCCTASMYAKFPMSEDSTHYDYMVGFDFKKENEFGDTIYYLFSNEYYTNNSNSVLIGEMANEDTPFITDSLVIPATVVYNFIEYNVEGMVYCAFTHAPKHVTTITIPRTLTNIIDSNTSLISGFAYSPFKSIYCDKDNPTYTSIDGILYSKDMKTLVAYPFQREDSLAIFSEGIECLGFNALSCNPFIKRLILPNSLKRIEKRTFFHMSTLKELILQDSVHTIGEGAFTRTPLVKLTIGSQIEEVHYTFLNRGLENKVNDSITLICHTLVPPRVNFGTTSNMIFVDNTAIHLYVPRQSLKLYQQAAGWKDCASILPIEPPIVTGVDTASVSWVQNFSATGYVWTLYTDEAKTQRFMSLTFDANGHLTHIDINSSHMPERMPALYHEDGEEEKRFAEYYSFTISGLSPDTRYYYTRQSLKGTEVIDEETGSFETLSNDPTGIKNNGLSSEPKKMIKDGSVLIRSGNATYNVQGSNIRE